MLSREVEYALEKIGECLTNAASWNYLRGMFPSIKLSRFSCKNTQHTRILLDYADYPQILNLCKIWLGEIGSGSKDVTATLTKREILSTLVHIYSQSGDPQCA